ncbi:hypothetical protein AURDEDRAFT_172162 [Auricularia subglabra TFB-10046 SS5]|nr:hypothetical protein AURDEDRAFT_172162 [Auricularia subglabra TFB-10046 SS5]
MASPVPVVPYDPELGDILGKLPYVPWISADQIQDLRKDGFLGIVVTAESLIAEAPSPFRHHEVKVPRPHGAELVMSVFTPTGSEELARPCIYHIHGGGMFLGDRFLGVSGAMHWSAACGAVIVSVEYRLAPEHPDPVPVEDCYAGLVWVVEHAAELGVDPAKILVGGTSAGGGLTAGVTLLARDRKGPALCGQLLNCAMLDDRMETFANKQWTEGNIWNAKSNVMGWTALLGDRRGGEGVSIYAAPGRATDLSGLPPTFIDVGSADIFRDDDVAYAQKLWAHGIQTELHVWPGGFHGFDMLAPQANLAKIATAAQVSWVSRLFKPWAPPA